MTSPLLSAIKFNEQGLLPAIAQDADSGDVLMMAWMNREAVLATVKEQRAVYFSRSRGQLWRKGESSGNVQQLVDIRLDCDGDTLLLKVRQIGGIACHTGRANCFYRALKNNEWYDSEPVIKDPESLYGSSQKSE
ncbi:MAG: phosphoribosyl-AMP cyclohydrolase [Halieaceae bacterium]|nr:phosphoribosyl-AMP cyclohydrolase [Halieaceae bacterium]